MRLRDVAVPIIFASLIVGSLVAQRVATMLSSRQVKTEPRLIITGSNLTEVATSRYYFETNIPSGAWSKEQAVEAVSNAFTGGFTTAVTNLIDSGGVRFSVTGLYSFAEGSTVSVDVAYINAASSGTTGVLRADEVVVGRLETPLLTTTNANIKVNVPLSTLSVEEATIAGELHTALIMADSITAPALNTRVIRPAEGSSMTIYHELGRSTEFTTTNLYSTIDEWSVVPLLKTEQSIFTDTVSVLSGTNYVSVTNVNPIVYDYAVTNTLPMATYTNDVGDVTNMFWQATVTNQPGDVEEQYWVPFSQSGAPPNVIFTPGNFVFTNGVGGVSTNLPYAVEYVHEEGTSYTNVMVVPIYTYDEQSHTWTNPVPKIIPDTGYVGVATTSQVLRVFPPGVLRTNAAGRCYIMEPVAIKPAGSGVKNDPFIITRPENFRYIREDHKPAGQVGAFPRDSGGEGRAWFSSPFEYMTAAQITNGNYESWATYCIQAADVDMTDTYLWCSSQWESGEYIEGFLGMSGAPAAQYDPRVTNTVSAGSIVASNLVAGLSPYGVPLFDSVYAAMRWSNHNFSHRIIYDGGGHSLNGIWVGLNPDAMRQARGLLGSVASSPTVKDLRVGGLILGRTEACPWTPPYGGGSDRPNEVAVASCGGLFGLIIPRVILAAGGTDSYRFGVLSNLFVSAYAVNVSNCIIFADVDIEITGDYSNRSRRPDVLRVGGIAGSASLSYNSDYRHFKSLPYDYIMPVRISNSSFVGRRHLRTETFGGGLFNNRVLGGFMYSDGSSMPTGYDIPFGYGHTATDVMHIVNASTVTGEDRESSYRGAIGPYMQDGFEGANAWDGYSGVSPTSYQYSYPTIPSGFYEESYPRLSAVGYYGSLSLSYGPFIYTNAVVPNYYPEGVIALSTALFAADNYLNSGTPLIVKHPNPTVLSAWDVVAINTETESSNPATTNRVGMDSICVYPDGGAGAYPWSVRWAGWLGTNGANMVIGAQALSTESFGNHNTGQTKTDNGKLIVARNTNPYFTSAPRSALTKRYSIEPPNEVGGGNSVNGNEYPYSKFDQNQWTRSGELDSWYPVPKGVAGLTTYDTVTTNQTDYPISITDYPSNIRVQAGTNDTTITTVHFAELAFTNRYAVAAEYMSPTSCLLSVVNQVYHRYSKTEDAVRTRASYVVTNELFNYEGAVTIDGTFMSSGEITVDGSVNRISSGDLDPYTLSAPSGARGNELGFFRIVGTNLTPVVLSPAITVSSNVLAFSAAVTPVYFEWWPDNVSSGLVASVTRGSEVVDLGPALYCASLAGDTFTFAADVNGYIIMRPGSPTDGLTRAADLEFPDVRYLGTNGAYNAFVPQPSVHYKFDGNTLDSSTNHLNGTWGAPAYSNGVFGSAASFNGGYGEQRLIKITDPTGQLTGASAMTWSYWVFRRKWNIISTYLLGGWDSSLAYHSAHESWSIGDGYFPSVSPNQNTNSVSMRFKGTLVGDAHPYTPVYTTMSPTNSMRFGEWQHVAVSFDSGYVTCLIDGKLATRFSVPLAKLNDISVHSNIPLYIGGSLSYYYSFWYTAEDLMMDDVRIYRHALPQDAIKQIMGNAAIPTMASYPSSNAVFQASFSSTPVGAPFMQPVPRSVWSRNDFHRAALGGAVIAGDTAYIDGINNPFPATLRVDVAYQAGASMQDPEFFGSVRPYLNYSDPAYNMSNGPNQPRRFRTSPTTGYSEYDVIATQLSIFQMRGSLGATATMSLIPKEWPYAE